MKRQIVLVLTLAIVSHAAFALAQDAYVTKSGYMAGVTEKAFDKAMTYIVQKDYGALQQLMDAGLVFSLKAGVRVYVMKTKLFKGRVKI